MRAKLKNIHTFFSLIIGLVIFSHAIIPHDHHFELSGDLKHCDNNTDKHKDNTDDNPKHCFYFNNVIIQKSSLTSNESLNKQVKAKFFAIKNIAVQEALFFKTTTIFSIPYFPENKMLSFSSPTRGSPYII